MIGISEETKILNGLVTQGSSNGLSGNTNNSFHCYNAELALFTTVPGVGGDGGVEVNLDGYARIALTGKSIGGQSKFGVSAAWDSTAGKYRISNTGPIQMHAIDKDEEDTAEVLGFGIYAATSASNSATKRLLAWGPLVDDNGDPVVASDPEAVPPVVGTAPVLVGGGVPVFYTGDFELLFGGENGGMASAECISLLNTLVQMGSTGATTGVTEFTLNSYSPELALFTTVPDAQGNNGVEVPTEIEVGGETVETGYTRKALWGYTPTTGVLQFAEPAGFSGTDLKVTVANTEEVQMSAISATLGQGTSYQVLGFGIYAASTGSSGAEKRLVAWGPLVDDNGDPVTASTAPVLSAGSVPIFYAGDFKLLLGGEGGTYVPVVSVSIPTPASDTISSFTDTIGLTATVLPANASVKSVRWSSSDETVATVGENTGVVSAAIRHGEATITVTTVDGGLTATQTVTSETAMPTGITATPATATISRWNQSGEPSGAKYLTTITFTVNPSTVAAGDKALTITTSGLSEKTRTENSVTVYSDTEGTYSVIARLQKNNSFSAMVFVTVTNY